MAALQKSKSVMDPNQEIENTEDLYEVSEVEEMDESASVDDFIKELEAKEKDLHITAETTFIEIAESFDDEGMPDFLAQEFSSNGHKTIEPASPVPLAGNQSADNTSLQNEIEELKGQLSKMEEERSEIFKNSQRRAKDFETLKARTERERNETFSSQISNLAVKMLPALDNLDRALNFASSMPEDKQNEFKQFFDGIVLVNQQVNDVLAGMGILPILTVGRTFDPHLHEAVAIEESTEFAPNTISEEMLRGYRIGDKVIRHSMVKVSKLSQGEPRQIIEAEDYGDIEFATEIDSSDVIIEVEETFLSDDAESDSASQLPEVE